MERGKFEENKNKDRIEGLEMYFNSEIVKKFAELEQNEKNYQVAEVIDKILVDEVKTISHPVFVAELGGGAHPDRYHNFFKLLSQKRDSRVDWVDISPYMLELAKKYISSPCYKERRKLINYIESDILDYLKSLKDEELDIAVMKYTFDHFEDVETLFELLSKKLKKGGNLISTMGNLDGILKSYSTNARYLYKGKEFPDNEIRLLKDNDSFTVKFFKVSGNPKSSYLKGAQVKKYFHSPEKLKKIAERFRFEIFLGNWKDYAGKEKYKEEIDQDVMILRRK